MLISILMGSDLRWSEPPTLNFSVISPYPKRIQPSLNGNQETNAEMDRMELRMVAVDVLPCFALGGEGGMSIV